VVAAVDVVLVVEKAENHFFEQSQLHMREFLLEFHHENALNILALNLAIIVVGKKLCQVERQQFEYIFRFV
jgi:hypothetical protein